MKLAIDAKALAAAVGRVAPFAARTTSLPALQCVKLEADGGLLRLSATNLDHSATTTVEAEVAEPGTVVAPAAVLVKSLGVFDGALDLAADPGSLDIAGASKSVTVLTADAAMFPRIAWPVGEPAPLGAAWSDVLAVAHAASSDTARPGLCVVGFEDGTVYATDSYRLSWAPASAAPDALVPATAVRRAAKILGAEVSMSTGAGCAEFTDGATTVLAQLHAGEAVKWRGLVPRSQPFELTFAAADMLDALAAVSVLDDATRHVRSEFDGDTLTLTRRVADVGTAVASLPATGSWPDPHVGFDQGYVAEAIRAVGGDTVTIGATDSNKPITMAGDAVSVLIMPVRIP